MTSNVRAVLVDIGPSVVLSAAASHELLYNSAPPWQWIISQALVWALVLRRRAPLAVLLLTTGLGIACIAVDGPALAALGVFVALHAVAWLRPISRTVAAALVVAAGSVFAAARLAPSRSLDDAIVVILGLAVLSVLLGVTQRSQHESLRALESRTRELEVERERNAAMAAQGERERIAREIHDIVAHSVSVMIALSEGAARAPEATARATMRDVARTGRDALADLRRVLSVLGEGADDPHRSDAYRPQPLLSDLPALVTEVRRAGLEVRLEMDDAALALPDGPQATIYRVVQESITNALKHAISPEMVTVEIRPSAETISVRVRDDGKQVPSAIATSTPGRGLRGMAERVRSYDGTVTAGPVPEGGWQVACVLPLATGSIAVAR